MLWLINAARGYDLTSEPQTLEALQNAFILIYRCNIDPCYLHIEASVLKTAIFERYVYFLTRAIIR